MVYVCTFGLEDKIRDNVAESIKAIRSAPDTNEKTGADGKKVKKDVNVRMVTGDHLETAKWVAI